MKNLLILFVLIFIVACNSTQKKKQEPAVEKEATISYRLELLWESDTAVRTPESVLLDRERDILYVSNINSGPWEKDGNGFISKMDKSGNIIELKWIEGISAPKGMGISGNSLFIADIDELVEANIETGEITNKYKVEGKPDLNDITVGGDGTVYVSGSGSNSIYKLNDGALEVIFTGEEGERFNGLFWEKERMLLLTSGSSQFKEIPWETMQAKIIAENMGHGDAIAPVGDGGYITTSWAGAIFYVSAEGEVSKLLDTEALEENAADADFCIEDQILYVPTFFKNQVKAYKLVKISD
jgi:outer membrane protein assembly factor BamB